MCLIWRTTPDGITRPLPLPNLPCLQRANWRYAAFLKLSIQNGRKLISLAWISLQLVKDTSNMPRRGILLKLSYMLSRKAPFLQHKSSCLSGTGLQTPHLHHWGVFWGGWDSSGTSSVEFRLSLPLLSNVSNSLFFPNLDWRHIMLKA